MTEINWSKLMDESKAEEKGDPLEPGTYMAMVVYAQARHSQNGKTYLRTGFKVIEDAPIIWDNAYLTPDKPKGLALFFRKLDALGFPATRFAPGTTLEEVAAEVLGAEVDITVNKEYDGYEKSEINKVIKYVATRRPEIPWVGSEVPAALQDASL